MEWSCLLWDCTFSCTLSAFHLILNTTIDTKIHLHPPTDLHGLHLYGFLYSIPGGKTTIHDQ